MHLYVDKQVLDLFPHLSLGIVRGRVGAERPTFSSELSTLRQAAMQRLASSGVENLPTHPNIATWRETYESFGVKVKKHPPTHEALARRLLKAATWPNINPIVDVYLSNQAYHLLPHGGYDEGTLTGDIYLTVSPGGEAFEPLGGGGELTDAGEVIYRDNARVLTRRWNYRDCDITKITEATREFVLMIEAPTQVIVTESISEACRDLVDRYARCFEGSFGFSVFTPTSHENSLDLDKIVA